MNFQRAWMFAAVALVAAGCVTDPKSQIYTTNNVLDMQMVAFDSNTVSVRWRAPNETFYTTFYGYLVTWKPVDGEITSSSDTGSMEIPAFENHFWNSANISNLKGKMYEFRVGVLLTPTSLAHDKDGAPVTGQAAPALHYSKDAARPGEDIRLYETASSRGSFLILDPDKGGPTRVAYEEALDLNAQFAILTGQDVPGDKVRFGIAGALYPEQSLPDRIRRFDLDVSMTPKTDTLLLGLPYWYMPHDFSFRDDVADGDGGPVDLPITNEAHPRDSYGFTANLQTDHRFEKRRWARIEIVPDNHGRLLRGEAPDRYVVLKLSIGYPNVPWA